MEHFLSTIDKYSGASFCLGIFIIIILVILLVFLTDISQGDKFDDYP